MRKGTRLGGVEEAAGPEVFNIDPPVAHLVQQVQLLDGLLHLVPCDLPLLVEPLQDGGDHECQRAHVVLKARDPLEELLVLDAEVSRRVLADAFGSV